MTDDDLREQMTKLSACTLPTAERPTRLAEFDTFFARSVTATARPAPTRLELRLRTGGDAEPVGRDLAARESACCSFFTFSFTPGPAGTLVMGIEVPPAYLEVLDALAGRAQAAVIGAGR
ncbi:hypothetical protein [Nocardia asteroides]|uniref:hypothetical protein n=1 Tax=Nocardia asteroides TaxID=1824 RepID=UPI001E2F50CE|nr:hypothetical protein [Nocardia asteroides]UGT62535.1 hypothetical protein LTT61_04080 [Nocardia asteroides]